MTTSPSVSALTTTTFFATFLVDELSQILARRIGILDVVTEKLSTTRRFSRAFNKFFRSFSISGEFELNLDD